MGISHTLFFGTLCCLGIWAWKHNRAWTIGFLLGFAAHVLTDVNDSIGTMLLFPFSTLNWSLHTWAYAATVKGGKYLDAAAYYSSLGFVMDLFWFFVVLGSWRVLTREFWRTNVVPADPHVWSWLGQWLDERGLLALYRGVFFYGVVPDDRVDDLGARRGASPSSTASNTTAIRGTCRGPGPWWVQHVHVAAGHAVGRAPDGADPAGRRLLRRERPLGPHGERQHQGDRLAERAPEDLLTREREHRVDGFDHVVTEDLGAGRGRGRAGS